LEPGSTGLLIFAVLLVAAGAFFSMSETAIMSVSRLSMRHLAQNGAKGAKLVEKIIDKREKFISTVLIGNNLVTIMVSSIVATYAINVAHEDNEALALTIATIVTTLVVVIFADIIPKVMASRFSDKLALFTARPVALAMFIFAPINAVFNALIKQLLRLFGDADGESQQTVTEQEVMTMLNMGYEEGIIPEEESQMIDAVFEFRKAHAGDIMTPRTDFVAISSVANYDEVMEVFSKERFTRLPVYEEDLDHIIGVINFKDFMLQAAPGSDFDVEKHMREPFFAYEQQSTQKLFANMRQNGAALAVVLDEYGGCAGLITLEDLVEQIMGDIFDEHDEIDDDIVCLTEGSEYTILGSTRIDDFNGFFDIALASEDYETMAGYVMGLFGYIPKQAEEISYENIAFVVEEVEKNRIEKLRVRFVNEVANIIQ